ncbi:hypothetical protein D9M68_857250 [compost metagenome]
MVDCDNRIAEYARRSNPFTDSDLLLLRAAASKLVLAGPLFTATGAYEIAQTAEQNVRLMTDMAARLEQVLQHQADAVTLEAAA